VNATRLISNHLARQVTPTELSGLRVCGVDGGLLKNTLRGVELVITRANATIFEYTPSNRVSAIYFPEKTTLPTVKAELTPISRREAELNASLERLKGELELAIRVQDHHPAELLLLDGSLRPHLNGPILMIDHHNNPYSQESTVKLSNYSKNCTRRARKQGRS